MPFSESAERMSSLTMRILKIGGPQAGVGGIGERPVGSRDQRSVMVHKVLPRNTEWNGTDVRKRRLQWFGRLLEMTLGGESRRSGAEPRRQGERITSGLTIAGGHPQSSLTSPSEYCDQVLRFPCASRDPERRLLGPIAAHLLCAQTPYLCGRRNLVTTIESTRCASNRARPAARLRNGVQSGRQPIHPG